MLTDTMTMESTGVVFSKTEKGREEMAKRSHGLNPVQRRVLIIIDGSKSFEALAEMIPAMVSSGQLRDILAYLLEYGFIAAVEDDQKAQSYSGKLGMGAAPLQRTATAPAQAPAQTSAPVQAQAKMPIPASSSGTAATSAALTDDSAAIRLVKDFMTTTAQTYLGLLSAPLIQRIEQARTAPQLMSVAGQWNMALRDSAQGKRFADPYLEQVRSALAASAKSALEMQA